MPLPPYKKNGVLCPLRYVGCQSKCERFATWKAERKKELDHLARMNTPPWTASHGTAWANKIGLFSWF